MNEKDCLTELSKNAEAASCYCAPFSGLLKGPNFSQADSRVNKIMRWHRTYIVRKKIRKLLVCGYLETTGERRFCNHVGLEEEEAAAA